MLQEYNTLVRAILDQPMDWKPCLDFEIGPDDRYYLIGSISQSDLVFRNQTGFDNWNEARRMASSYGYDLIWEV